MNTDSASRQATEDDSGESARVLRDVWKAMAGSSYDELLRSKESAIAHVFDANSDVRSAAISICELHWRCYSDDRFVDACRKIAATDCNEAVRVHAIGALGTALRSSGDNRASQFLADTVKDDRSAHDVRIAAYWALREVQMGPIDRDVIKRSIRLGGLVLAKMPLGAERDRIERALQVMSSVATEGTDQIDREFVERFASNG
jgi:HEAT repeats